MIPSPAISPPAGDDLVDAIDALLPQTQCTKCGFDGCRPYAEAIARQASPINRCPPGGETGINRLAALLGRPPLSLDPSCGEAGPRRIAWIDPQHCIGCTLCIQACPVDAIIGARKRMHTVIESLCTGCDLCVAPCPVDCIEMRPAPSADWSTRDAQAARERHQRRNTRLRQPAAGTDAASRPSPGVSADARRQRAIERAMQQARERLARARPASGPDGGS